MQVKNTEKVSAIALKVTCYISRNSNKSIGTDHTELAIKKRLRKAKASLQKEKLRFQRRHQTTYIT